MTPKKFDSELSNSSSAPIAGEGRGASLADTSQRLESNLKRDTWSASAWIDWFESDRQKLARLDLESYFPDRSHPEFDLIVSEILRAELEWRWGKGSPDGFEQLVHEVSWIVDRPAIINPLAFEDFRLANSMGVIRSRQAYDAFAAIDSSFWQSWLGEAEAEGEPGLASTARNAVATIPGAEGSFSHAPGNSSRASRISERFPKPSARLGELELLAEIGAGAFSRVYIARQTELARRLIVVKVMTRPLGESQRLARLQHGNIMPLYFAQQIDGFYVIGMPLLGATNLKDVLDCRLKQVERVHDNKRLACNDVIGLCLEDRHRELTKTVLDLPPLAVYSRAADRAEIPAVDQAGDGSWIRQVFLLGMSLAEALEYSHKRGVQHRDIKPANVLIGFDRQPLLLDFNLGHVASPHERNRGKMIGGTLPYMSPEQLQAMLGGAQAIPDNSDVYSLGVVLYEALTGRLPHDFSTCRANDVVRAIQLRQQTVPNPRTLNPLISPAEAEIVMNCLVVDPALRYASAAHLATDISQHLENRPLRYANNPSLRERFAKFRARNPRLCSLYSILTAACFMLVLAVWAIYQWHASAQQALADQSYRQFIRVAHAAEAELFFADGGSREEGQRLAQEALEIFETSPANRPPASPLHAHLSSVQQEFVDTTSAYLYKLCQADSLDHQSFAAGDSGNVMELAAQAYFGRRFADAIRLLDKELEQNPARFAAWFLKGKCHFEQRDFRDADRCYANASMLEPDSTLALVSRGICHFSTNEQEQARQYFEAALDKDPDNFAAHYNLALVYEKCLDFDQALKQLDQAARFKPGSTRVTMSRSRIARAAGKIGLAERSLQDVLNKEPVEPEGWILRGLARVSVQPELALDDFRNAAKWPETRCASHQNQAHVLSEILGRTQEAIEVLDALLAEYPDFQPALSGRAVLQARLGNHAEAVNDVNRCLDIAGTPQIHYHAACVYALLSQQQPELKRRALYHLAVASAPAYGAGVIASDKDLNNLHGDDQFQKLLEGINTATGLSRSAPLEEK